LVMSDTIENVLILQGGGSLDAFGCGVYKALANSNIKIDIIAGTSIGGLNASIIACSKEDYPEKALEQYWLELAEGTTDLNFPFVERTPESPLVLTPTPLPTTAPALTTSLPQPDSYVSYHRK
jgi:predicted acylesterase/phospholipase RssA